jgi:ATP-grasp domain, R2K clade family 3
MSSAAYPRKCGGSSRLCRDREDQMQPETARDEVVRQLSRHTMSAMKKTSLLYWFPRLNNLELNLPRTIIIPQDRRTILEALDGKPLPQGHCERLLENAARLGYPLFARTDLASGKHSWANTCYVPSADVLIRHVLNICEENEMAQIIGLDYCAIVLREFLQLETSFTAFAGFPVNKERRYFVRDGEVLCHHPYWPEGSIENHTNEPHWREKLVKLNAEDADEIALLSDYAVRVSKALGDCWSVDFAKAKDGKWYLIDMAQGHESFHWAGCPLEFKIAS